MVSGLTLEVSDLRYTYAKSQRGVTSFSCQARAGDITAIAGASGSGKTTILAGIAGLLNSSGTIRYGNRRLHQDEVSLAMQRCLLFERLSIQENVATVWGYPNKRRRARAVGLLVSLGLDDVIDALPSEVSGGQRQRAALAVQAAARRPVQLLDEPTSSLDDASAALVIEMLQQSAGLGNAVLVATHDPRILRVADRQERVEL